jgi:hypothetical protein
MWHRRARAEGEHPDFVIDTSTGQVGIEFVSYGARSGREVDAAWDALIDHSVDFRERHPDLNRFGARALPKQSDAAAAPLRTVLRGLRELVGQPS